MLIDQDEPTSYKKAIKGPDSEKWQAAMKSEMQSMYDNQVWTLIIYLMVLKPLGINGFSRRKLTWMAICIPLKQD